MVHYADGRPHGELTLRTLAMPSDANAAGDIFGGWVMAQMDLACGIRAAERARGRVVTAAVKEMAFAKAMKMMPADGGMLWIAWPKKAAKADTDLDENLIRDFGLAQGVVDTKVCAIDATWSGLRFSRRRS